MLMSCRYHTRLPIASVVNSSIPALLTAVRPLADTTAPSPEYQMPTDTPLSAPAMTRPRGS